MKQETSPDNSGIGENLRGRMHGGELSDARVRARRMASLPARGPRQSPGPSAYLPRVYSCPGGSLSVPPPVPEGCIASRPGLAARDERSLRSATGSLSAGTVADKHQQQAARTASPGQLRFRRVQPPRHALDDRARETQCPSRVTPPFLFAPWSGCYPLDLPAPKACDLQCALPVPRSRTGRPLHQ